MCRSNAPLKFQKGGKSGNGAYYFPFHTQVSPPHSTHTLSLGPSNHSVATLSPRVTPLTWYPPAWTSRVSWRWNASPSCTSSPPGRWHWPVKTDVSGVNRLHSELHPVSVANTRSCVSHWLMAGLEHCLIYSGFGSTASANTSIPLPRGIWKFNASVQIIKYTDFLEKT